uniref:MADF domain-containing protein n=3 Tax=Photinus pyralis TaxID=7054 RepID=A0A1Y1MUA1_PHOPY
MIDEDDMRLIDVVQQFRQIYDKSSPNFKNKRAKQNAWTTVAQMLERTPVDCESRFTVLRNRFVTEKRKLQVATASGAGGDVVEPSPLYKKLEFLLRFIKSRQTTSNVQMKNAAGQEKPGPSCSATGHRNAQEQTKAGPSNPWDTINTILEGSEVEVEEFYTESNIEDSQEDLDEETHHDIQQSEDKENQEPVARKKRKLDTSGNKTSKKKSPIRGALEASLNKFNTYLAAKQEKADEMIDKELSFGRTVGLYLKELDAETRQAKQLEIMNILFSK